MDNFLYNENRVFSRYEAWQDILLNVNFESGRVMIKGKVYEVKAGQSLLSMDSWAKRWNWSKSAVRRFLNLLQNESMIEIVTDNISTHLTVCNWDAYQVERNANETRKKLKRNSNEIQTTPIKEEEEEKEVKKQENEVIDYDRFIAWFNKRKLWIIGAEGKFKSMKDTDKNNLKKLKESGYTREDFDYAFDRMTENPWVKENNMITIGHFLRNDNFVKYLNAEKPKSKFNPLG